MKNPFQTRRLDRRAFARLLAGAGPTLFALSLSPAHAQEDALARIKAQGFARVGFSNVSPWGFVNEKGELDGVEPTLARAFLKSIGVPEIDGVLTPYVSLIPALQAGRFDMIGAGMQIRPARCEQIAFGDPEWVSQQAFVTPKGNPKKLFSLQDVIEKGARLGVVSGGAEREYAALNGVSAERIVVFPDLAAVASGLRSERADVAMFAAISVRGFIKTQGADAFDFVAMSRQPLDKDGRPAVGYGAMGIRKGEARLLAAWNAWLAAARSSGELLALLSRFGLEASDLAGADISVDRLCAAK